MGDPLEKLSLAAPHAMPYQRMARATGDRITGVDVAHALARVHDPASSLLGRVMLQAEGERVFPDTSDLERRILVKLAGDRRVQGWKGEKDMVRRMIRLAIVETVSPSTCAQCHGRGERPDGPRVIPCGNCGGTGRKGIDHQQRAKAVGISRQAWYRYWRGRYEDVIVPCLREAEQGLRQALRGLSG